MSIATKEADRLYPIHHADIMDGDPIDAMQPAIDVLQNEAYVKGRTAEPCEKQVEAVAQYLCDTGDDWNRLKEADRQAYRATAWDLLILAQKTVSAEDGKPGR